MSTRKDEQTGLEYFSGPGWPFPLLLAFCWWVGSAPAVFIVAGLMVVLAVFTLWANLKVAKAAQKLMKGG